VYYFIARYHQSKNNMQFITFNKKPNGTISLIHRVKRFKYLSVINQTYVSNQRSILFYSADTGKLSRLANKIKSNSLDIWITKNSIKCRTGFDAVDSQYHTKEVRLITASEYMHLNRLSIINEISNASVIVLFHNGLDISRYAEGNYQRFLLD
jgi:hypothetical protein